MELKPYQQGVINDLSLFLEHLQETKSTTKAFHEFWAKHPKTPLQPSSGSAIEPYKNNIPNTPHICIKVPTAGGKTFIACNALKTIFDAFAEKPKVVVWLVPSITILDQTIQNLKDTNHPYRQKINAHFGNKVAVFDKATLLQGNGFDATSVKEQLSIMLFSFDSLRAKNKEDRKVFQENGNLQSFEYLLGEGVDLTLGEVIKKLNPVVVVDESHNAESDLSIEMLKALNPSFILDLTATPRKNSNIVSFIDALELKRENMVKLPVVVYNHENKTDVILSAIQLQKKLEAHSITEQKKGGKYVRPIVLFQAQPKNAEDSTTFQKLKEKLIELGIKEGEIKIKTAEINEIKSEDLMNPNCEVRYIITINALKEGWDCPFAYILASLADKNSAVDVEQILGRILRLPYVSRNNFPLLNASYVMTASANFNATLQNIVKGLNKSGFSDKDYKLVETVDNQTVVAPQLNLMNDLFGEKKPIAAENDTPTNFIADIDFGKIQTAINDDASETATFANESIDAMELMAMEQNAVFEKTIQAIDEQKSISLPNELQKLVKTTQIKEIFKAQATAIALPQFYVSVPGNTLFGTQSNEILLSKETLLEGFSLSKENTNIAFESVGSNLYMVDLDETKKEHTPTFLKIDGQLKESLVAYILDPSKKENRVKNFTARIVKTIGNMYPISDKEIEKYVTRVLEDFTDEQFTELANNEYSYVDKIKKKINALSEEKAEQRFKELLDTDAIFIKKSYQFAENLILAQTGSDITKSLYEKEGTMNAFEIKVINEIANMPNVAFWTRNASRTGFAINGFINHYPDFVIQTKGGKTLILETKGDHLDAEPKIRLGNRWASKAGNDYRYFMVYENRSVNGAYKLDDFLEMVKKIN